MKSQQDRAVTIPILQIGTLRLKYLKALAQGHPHLSWPRTGSSSSSALALGTASLATCIIPPACLLEQLAHDSLCLYVGGSSHRLGYQLWRVATCLMVFPKHRCSPEPTLHSSQVDACWDGSLSLTLQGASPQQIWLPRAQQHTLPEIRKPKKARHLFPPG